MSEFFNVEEEVVTEKRHPRWLIAGVAGGFAVILAALYLLWPAPAWETEFRAQMEDVVSDPEFTKGCVGMHLLGWDADTIAQMALAQADWSEGLADHKKQAAQIAGEMAARACGL